MTRYKKQDPEISRRKFINVAMGATAAVGGVSLLSVLGTAHPMFRLTADKMPPLPGDILVHAGGEKAGQAVSTADLSNEITRAWPRGKDKDGNMVTRDAEPNNILALYKYPKGGLIAAGKPTESGKLSVLDMAGTIDGQIVCYSDKCTHAGCNVSDNTDLAKGMNCPCHSGQYDPKGGCVVIGGPPPRPLAQLPIKLEGNEIVVTGFFNINPYGYAAESDWEKMKEILEEEMSKV